MKVQNLMCHLMYSEIYLSNYNCDIYQYIKLGMIIRFVHYINYIVKILPIITIHLTRNKKNQRIKS